MGKKRSRQQQSSNVPVGADSSESGDGATDKISLNKPVCSHVTKSIECNQIKKNISLYVSGRKQCTHCKDGVEEDNKNVDGNEDFWICLRCGAKTCTLEHSLMHYNVPRSDSHALTLKVPAFTVWCHTCKADIPSGYNKKLKTCISSVEQLYNKQINLQPLTQQELENSSKKDENNIKKGNKPNEQFNQNPSKKNLGQKAGSTAPSVRGLTNLGNTCFFNSVLQCLAQTPGLVEAIREMSIPDQHVDISLKSGKTLSGTLGQWDSLSECLADTLVKLQSGGPVVSPDRLLSLLTKKQTQFQGYQQHDAHELFTYLIDSVRMTDQKRYRKLILSEFGLYGNPKQLQKDVEEETTKKLKALDHEVAETIIFAPEKVFRGRLVNRIECQECLSVKTFEETFLDLSLPIVPDKPQPPCMRRKGGHQPYVQHQSLVDSFKDENKSGESNSAAGSAMTKSQLKKERRLQRKKNKKQGKVNNRESKTEEAEEATAALDEQVTEEFKDNEEGQQESDVEGDIEDNSEETNCGSKGSSFPKSQESSSSHMANVNCGNQGVWLDSNDSLSSESLEKEKMIKASVVCNHISEDRQEESKNMIGDLFGTQVPSVGSQIKESSLNQELCDGKEEVDSLCTQEKEIEGKLIECTDQDDASKAQVTAWLKSSNLITIPDSEEVDREVSPPLIPDISNTEGSVNEASFNKFLPQAQSSVCYNQQQISLPLDESRSAPQETQESGYCSEKLGCAESPQRDDSPCSLDALSPPWSGMEGALSSSVEEVFNNAINGNAEEDGSTETAEVATSTVFNHVPSNSETVVNREKRDNWISNCHPPAHVRRRPPSPPIGSTAAVVTATAQVNGKLPAMESSTIMCSKWLKENSKLPPFEEEKEEEESNELLNEKLSTVEGMRRGKRLGIKEFYERDLGDIEEEDSGTKYNVVYGPLNKDQIAIGDIEASDTNSNDINQVSKGTIARPGSPCEACNEVPDLKDVEINNINEEQRFEDLEENALLDINKKEEFDKKTEDRIRNVEVNEKGDIGGDLGMTCGCNRVSSQRAESIDKCCLHTSLAQSTQAELMTGCNKIACEKCSSDGKVVYTNSTKQTLISQAPPALVIHLKRFQVQMMSCRKLSRHVSFPLQLDLTPYAIPVSHQTPKEENIVDNDNSALLYSLYGLVEHSGTMNGGHYVAYIKVSRDNSSFWYCISDSHVSQVTETRVLSAQAYLLFYKRIKT